MISGTIVNWNYIVELIPSAAKGSISLVPLDEIIE